MMNRFKKINVVTMNTAEIKETQGGLAVLGAGAIAGLALVTYLASSVFAFTQMGD